MVLHATVADDKGQFVPGLKQDNFQVFEDKVEQKISVFSHEDIPVTMGLVIDNSGSMREKRAQVNAAALSFVKTSNPADEVFVVNFNDEYYLDLDEDFTSDQQELHEALERIDSRGSTALYDAIIGSLDHLKKGHKDKRVLLVITDGDDDASRKSFEYTVKAAERIERRDLCDRRFQRRRPQERQENGAQIQERFDRTRRSHRRPGLLPRRLEDVDPVCAQVARDIRNQYTLGYYPTNTAKDGTFRAVQVELIAPKGHGKLSRAHPHRLLRRRIRQATVVNRRNQVACTGSCLCRHAKPAKCQHFRRKL